MPFHIVSMQIMLEERCPNRNSPSAISIKSDSGTPLICKRVCIYFSITSFVYFAWQVKMKLSIMCCDLPKKFICIVHWICKVSSLSLIKITSKSLEMTCQNDLWPAWSLSRGHLLEFNDLQIQKSAHKWAQDDSLLLSVDLNSARDMNRCIYYK